MAQNMIKPKIKMPGSKYPMMYRRNPGFFFHPNKYIVLSIIYSIMKAYDV